MTRNEFLQQLRKALENDLSGNVIQDNVDYYSNYISDEVRNGKSEEEVLGLLGDPWVLARTIIDAQDGTDDTIIHDAAGESKSGYGSKNNGYGGNGYDRTGQRTERQEEPRTNKYSFDTWWKKLLLILVIVMAVVIVISIVTGLIRVLAPIIIPIFIIILVIRAIGNRRSR